MNITLNLSQRLWLIEAIGSLPSTTALIKEADGFIGYLAPKDSEISTEGLNFTANENGLVWDLEVEATSIPKLIVEVPVLIYDALKTKYSVQLKDPTSLDLEMLSLLEI